MVFAVVYSQLDPARDLQAKQLAYWLRDVDGRDMQFVSQDAGHRESAVWLPYDQLSPQFVSALLASEDQRYFEHAGVDVQSLARAAWLNVSHRRWAFGGSTLTMQLARRMLSQGKSRSLTRKAVEAIWAIKAEHTFDKHRLLEEYVHRLYFGHGAYGLVRGAWVYFGKTPSALSFGEALILAVLVRGASFYDPIRHPERLDARRRHIADLLVEQGRLAPRERDLALRMPIPTATFALPTHAPEFGQWLLREGNLASPMIEPVIDTTVDLRLQEQLRRQADIHVQNLAQMGVQRAAVVVLHSKSGEIAAMVGHAQDADAPGASLDMTTWRRHPGSALKPFIYAAAIEGGAAPTSLVYDQREAVPRRFVRGEVHEHGPRAMRDALAGSYNLAAVELLQRLGVGVVLEKLQRAGVVPADRSAAQYDLELALGAPRVRLIDLALGYTAFVDHGKAHALHGMSSSARDALPDNQIFTPETASSIVEILSDSQARREVFGHELPFDLPWPVVAKTGTAAGFADSVAVVATQEWTIVVWNGRIDGRPTQGLLGMQGAGELARDALLLTAGGRRWTLPTAPENAVSLPICELSGMLATSECPHQRTQRFLSGQQHPLACNWHQGGQLEISALPGLARAWFRRYPLAGQHMSGGQSAGLEP